MTVAQLIEHLQRQRQDLLVGYCCYSEMLMMQESDIEVISAQPVRHDGWIHSARPDKPTQDYLIFPGN